MSAPAKTGANALRGEAEVRVGAAVHVLRPSFAALVAAEGELGPLFALVERAADGRLGLGELAALFWHCVKDRPEEMTREGLGEAVVEQGLAAVTPGAARAAGADPVGAMKVGRDSDAPALHGRGWSGVSKPGARPLDRSPCASPEGQGLFGPAALPLIGLMARVAGWRPEDFWAATPGDVRAVLTGWIEADAEASLDSAVLAAMMERFPDG